MFFAIPAHWCRAPPPPCIDRTRHSVPWTPVISLWFRTEGEFPDERAWPTRPFALLRGNTKGKVSKRLLKPHWRNAMTRKITRRSAVALAAAAPVALATRGFAQSPIVIKFSHVVANDTPKGKGSLKFKELAEKYTDGKVKVEVYPNSSLYKDKEEIEALQLGSVQMLAPSTAKFAPLGVKEFEALDLPWLFKNDQVYTNAIKGQVGQWLFAKLESKGISGLAYWDNGFHMVSANRPLLAPP